MTKKENTFIWNKLTITKLLGPKQLPKVLLLLFKTVVGNDSMALKEKKSWQNKNDISIALCPWWKH